VRLRIALASVLTLLVSTLLAVGALSASAATFTLNSLSASVDSAGNVTASTSVTASSTVTASYYGVCVRSARGANLDYGKRTNVVFSAGVPQPFSATKQFAAGTYTYFACLQTSGTWVNVGASKQFTVGSTPTPTPTPPPPSGNGPTGVSGTFTQTFDDEFSGTAVDTTKWQAHWYNEGGTMNGVGTYAANAAVANGALSLTLASANSGALVHTDIAGGYRLPVGSCAEARILFPGSGSTIYNWPAWWASSAAADGWPSSGEHDIAEGLGTLTINYHSPSGAHNMGTVPGTWAGAFHIYTLCRNAGSADVYWDGVLRQHYTTDDNGKPEILILNVGRGGSAAYGAAGAVQVDYVRAWARA
jgi:hypothetical protein